MVRTYLRYEKTAVFGLVTSGAIPCYDATGRLLITSALENVAIWNVKQGVLVKLLEPTNASTSGSNAIAEVTCIARAQGSSNQIAVGYSDGTVRLWDISSGDCQVTLKGHKSAVSCLRYSPSGSLLASGSRDTDLIVWDVVGEAGLFRLRGHKDQVTDLVFLSGGGDETHTAEQEHCMLVSSSKDGLVKVWDLSTQHCCQTVTGFKAEVWALDSNPTNTRLVAGSTDHELRVYRVTLNDSEEQEAPPPVQKKSKKAADGTAAVEVVEAAPTNGGVKARRPVLHFMGSVKRAGGGHDRVAQLRFDAAGAVLAVQSAGKQLELFKVRSEEDAIKKLKRRRKRRREKVARKAARKTGTSAPGVASSSESESEGEGEGAEGSESEAVRATDELEPFQVISCKQKVRSFAFAPLSLLATKRKAAAGSSAKEEGPVLCQLALCLSNNSVECVDVKETGTEVAQRLDLAGHRSDVRAVALSEDDQLLATGSNSALKIWNPRTGACLSTIDSGYALAILFAPGGRHAVVGTKEGTLELFDLGAAERVASEVAHEGAVWSLSALPDKSGFVSGSADKTVKFWLWHVVVGKDGAKQLRLQHARTLRMADDVLCVRVSPDGKLLAVALLDSTVKVFYTDSLKFFLSLYGHKLPVLSMDISSDSTLLVTASADKNLKVWGLDFGDCHKSLFAHGEAVMAVSFVPGTHFAFSVGKDKLLKYWDLDRHELLLELGGSHGEVWCCAVSSSGDLVVTGGHDRSLRRWERTREPFFVEEEKERRLESMFEADLEAPGGEAAGLPAGGAAGGTAEVSAAGEGGAAPAGRKTLEAAGAADALADALDVAAHDLELRRQRQQSVAAGGAPPPHGANPLMLGLSPSAYVLRSLVSVRPGDLESALLMLPLTDALHLMEYLPVWLEQGAGQHVELVARVAVLLLRLNHSQLMSLPAARPTLMQLRSKLHTSVTGLKDTLGFNVAALQHLQRALKERRAGGMGEPDEEGTAVKSGLSKGENRGAYKRAKGKA